MVLMTGYNQPPPPEHPAGKYGRLPGHVPNGLRDLTWYVAGSLPVAPSEVEPPAPGKLGNWAMLGNDQYGDCGVAGIAHGEMCVADDVKRAQLNLTDQEAVQYYLTYTGGQDNGVVLADFLAYVKKTTWFTRQLGAYAPVSVTDLATLRFVINAYGYAYTGIQVTDLMEQAFSNGAPWTSAMFTQGTVQGGHCVPLVGYDETHLYCVTWGRVQAILYPGWNAIAEEAWATIWDEVPAGGLDNHGVNLKALNSDLKLLTR